MHNVCTFSSTPDDLSQEYRISTLTKTLLNTHALPVYPTTRTWHRRLMQTYRAKFICTHSTILCSSSCSELQLQVRCLSDSLLLTSTSLNCTPFLQTESSPRFQLSNTFVDRMLQFACFTIVLWTQPHGMLFQSERRNITIYRHLDFWWQ